MKVITIKEPYVTPIMLGMKHYETRSWKTNYRGEIYIHTAKTLLPNDVTVVPRLPLGCIVLKARLTDCIYMDDEFVNAIKANETEYKLGFYEVGRYAWKLENVKVIDPPIKAKGKLGIWTWQDGNMN